MSPENSITKKIGSVNNNNGRAADAAEYQIQKQTELDFHSLIPSLNAQNGGQK